MPKRAKSDSSVARDPNNRYDLKNLAGADNDLRHFIEGRRREALERQRNELKHEKIVELRKKMSGVQVDALPQDLSDEYRAINSSLEERHELEWSDQAVADLSARVQKFNDKVSEFLQRHTIVEDVKVLRFFIENQKDKITDQALQSKIEEQLAVYAPASEALPTLKLNKIYFDLQDLKRDIENYKELLALRSVI